MKIVHQGRGGYIEIDGSRYQIEHVQDGHFSILFPGGLRHRKLQLHLNMLAAFAHDQQPEWYVENRSRLVAGSVSPDTANEENG